MHEFQKENKIRLQKENKSLKQNVLTKRRIHNQRFHHNTFKNLSSITFDR